jgi:hypothetical protein
MDHRALSHFRLDGRKLVLGTPSGSLHDFVNHTLADLHPVQFLQRFLGALIAHVLFLAVVPHYYFQAGAEQALHFQTGRRNSPFRLAAVRTVSFVLAHFDHLGTCRRQLGNLVHLQAERIFKLCACHPRQSAHTKTKEWRGEVLWFDVYKSFTLQQ